MKRVGIITLFCVNLCVEAHAQGYSTICFLTPRANCDRCYYISEDGRLSTPDPVDASCFASSTAGTVFGGGGQGSEWGATYSESPDKPEKFPPPSLPTTAGNGTPGTNSGYAEAGLGAMATILSRIFNDGAYGQANQQVAARIDDLVQSILNRVSDLDHKYPELVTRTNQAKKDSAIKLKDLTSAIRDAQSSTRMHGQSTKAHWNVVMKQNVSAPSPFGGSEDQLITDLLRTDERLARIESGLPLSHLRIGGHSLVRSLDPIRLRTYGDLNPLQREIKLEVAKEKELFSGANGSTDPELAAAEKDLIYASKFSESMEAQGKLIAEALVSEARSIRYYRERGIQQVYTATLDNHGQVRLIPGSNAAIDKTSIRKQSESFEESWRSSQLLHNMLDRELQLHPRRGYEGVRASRLVIVTGLLLHNAVDQFYKGDLYFGSEILNEIRTLLNVAAVVSPGFTFARSLYECISGEDYLNGDHLNSSDRGIAGWYALSYGFKPVAIALSLTKEAGVFSAAERTLDEILEDESAFDRWLARKFPSKRPYPPDSAQKIWGKLQARGLDPELDPGHPSGAWRTPHIHVRGKNIHIPVSSDFKPK
jgi:hypothetical protein